MYFYDRGKTKSTTVDSKESPEDEERDKRREVNSINSINALRIMASVYCKTRLIYSQQCECIHINLASFPTSY